MFILLVVSTAAAGIVVMLARSQHAERMGVGVQRRTSMSNSLAINRDHAFRWMMRDSATRSAGSSTLNGWGGMDSNPVSGFSPFRSTQRPSNATSTSFPFNNLRPLPTPDAGTFFSRYTTDAGTSQVEQFTLFNYVKTYSVTLLDDLMVVHRRPSGATGTFELSDNIRVEGRVVIWDADATTENLRAQACVCANPRAVRTVKNTLGSALVMPENWNAPARPTAGYGGSSQPHAISDGTLKMADNADFKAGSIRHIMEDSANYTQHTGPVLQGLNVLGLIGSTLGGIVNLSTLSPTGPNPVIISRTTLANMVLPSASGSSIGQLLPPLAGNLSLLNIGVVLADHPSLPHVAFTSSIDLVIIVGELLPLSFNATSHLPPRIIWVDQSTKPRHVIFVGESNRKLVFVTGRGTGQNTYVGFLGVTQLLTSGPLRWRLQWINEFAKMNVIPPPIFSHLECTGSLRTDWSFSILDSGSSDRFVLKRDSNPDGLERLLPRDGWVETLVKP